MRGERARRARRHDDGDALQRCVRRTVDDEGATADLAQNAGLFEASDRRGTEVRFGSLASCQNGVVGGCDVTSAVQTDKRGHGPSLRTARPISRKQRHLTQVLATFWRYFPARASFEPAQMGWAAVTRAFISRTACCQPTKMAWATIE